MKTPLFFWLALFFIPAGLFAQTTITSDSIAVNTTWDAAGSPYHIAVPELNIYPNVTLTVDAGVTITFIQGGFIRVWNNARLETLGAVSDSVFMRPQNVGDTWAGIRSSADVSPGFDGWTVALTYTDLRDVSNGIFGFEEWTSSSNTPVFLSHSTFENCSNVAVYTSMRNLIQDCLFRNNNVACYGEFGFENVLRRCRFENNQVAYNYGTVEDDFENNVFDGNHIGIRFEPDGSSYFEELYGNEFMNNDTAIINLAENTSMWIAGNLIHDNVVGITFVDADPSPFENIFRSNEIRDNGSAIYFKTNEFITLRENCWGLEDSVDIVQGFIAANGISPSFNLTPHYISCTNDLVYPGDTDHDQDCKMNDLFPIGIYFGTTGPARTSGGLAWVGNLALNWGDTLANGRDIKHVDCNGDGTINLDDTTAIMIHLGKTHQNLRGGGTGLPLFFEMPDTAQAGMALTIPIHLGLSDTVAEDLYGISFSIVFDTNIVASAALDFSNSWLGMPDTSMIALSSVAYDSGYVHAGMVRIDGIEQDGYGAIASLKLQLKDPLDDPFNLSLSFANVSAVQLDESPILINGQAANVQYGTVSVEEDLSAFIQIFPNPVEDHINIHSQSDPLKRIYLYDLSGKLLLSKTTHLHSEVLSMASYPSGLYLLTIETTGGQYHQKIQK